MDTTTYSRERSRLLGLANWHGWAARRGYNPSARAAHRANQAELVALRAGRKAVV